MLLSTADHAELVRLVHEYEGRAEEWRVSDLVRFLGRMLWREQQDRDRQTAVEFTIPGKPIGKGRAKATHIPGLGVRMYTPKKTANYEGLIAHTAQIAMRGLPLIDGPVCLDLLIRCEVPVSWSQKKQRMALAGEIFPATKPDADNIIKAVCDGCNGVVWRDDVLAVDGSWKKCYSAVPGVVVTITPIVPNAGLREPTMTEDTILRRAARRSAEIVDRGRLVTKLP